MYQLRDGVPGARRQRTWPAARTDGSERMPAPSCRRTRCLGT